MTKDDVIRMAREAGPLISTPFDVWCEHFAALVAAAEREECAKLCEGRGMVKGGEVFASRIRARGTT
jgi:hypothetical protein